MDFCKRFSFEPDVAEARQPAQAGCIENPAITQICESFDEHRDQPPDPFVFAYINKVIEIGLFPIICQCILTGKI
jgi:hypothetical protein